MKINGKRPNFLIITTDEERFPPVYEDAEAAAYREKYNQARREIECKGLNFLRHYTATTACAPSRATIYTGQYPSLHGVSQTPGLAKSSFDPGQFWLDPGTVPTLGDYFRAGGYRTFYKGKWHVSDEDIPIPGSRSALLTNNDLGVPYPDRIKLYEDENRLRSFGFDGWIGPEPHGSRRANDGTNRDPGFASQAVELLQRLDAEVRAEPKADRPWLTVCSFVNPHDIVLFRAPWFPVFQRLVESGQLPTFRPAPTHDEPLDSKPRCQKDYVLMYPRMYVPQPQVEEYYQFYYYLMAEVDRHIGKVYDTLKACSFYENTIVLFTSDHGDMLGAHGGMQQKWFNAYEETIHVPFVLSNPTLFPKPKTNETLTSHVDIVPTLLGLADIDQAEAAKKLKRKHSEVRRLVGRDLSGLLTGEEDHRDQDETVYFMTDDQINTGLDMTNRRGDAYRAIIQPSHVETVITRLPDGKGGMNIWKYSRYFDNPRFVGKPGNQDQPYVEVEAGIPAEFECYNLSEDPEERVNLASPLAAGSIPEDVQDELERKLAEQRIQKRLLPRTLNRDASDIGFLRD